MSGTTTTTAPAAELEALPVLPAALAGSAVVAALVPGSNGAAGTPYAAPYPSFNPATPVVAGLVKPGTGLSVSADGTMSLSGTISLAGGGTGANTAAGARGALGLAPVASSGNYSDLVGAPAAYVLPPATTVTLGGVRPDGTTITVNAGVISVAGGGGGTAGVASFNSRVGAVSLGASDVNGALGYTAYSAANPSGYQTAGQVSAATVANVSGTVAVVNGGTGATSAAGALTALGAYPASNPSGYQTANQVAGATVANVSGTVALANGGTGATTAAAARVSLGLATVASSGNYSDLSGAPAAYVLPPATTSALGGVRPDGTSITVSGGVISASSGPPITPVTTIAASGASQVLAAAANGNRAFDITLTGNCTLSLSGGTAGQQQTITLYLRQDATAGRAPTLPANVKWSGGAAPTPNTAAGVIDVFQFVTPDAGATWFGTY